jgi:hypothetical protein
LEVVSTSPDGHAEGADEDESTPGSDHSAEASRVDGDAESKRGEDLEKPVEHAVESSSAKGEEGAIEGAVERGRREEEDQLDARGALWALRAYLNCHVLLVREEK